jgi:uncharacterized membrane protein
MFRTDHAVRLGRKQLRRLEVFLDVVYALLFVQMLLYLPQAEDMAWVSKRWGLLQPLIDRPVDLLRILLGLGLILVYWNLSNKLLGPLARTNALHAVLSLLQLVFVCFFIYFAISDPKLAGGASSPALQSVCLALAGFVGVGGWVYARRRGLVDETVDDAERARVLHSSLLEPITAVINTPIAFIGPLTWTIGWLTIPFVVRWITKRLTASRSNGLASEPMRNS